MNQVGFFFNDSTKYVWGCTDLYSAEIIRWHVTVLMLERNTWRLRGKIFYQLNVLLLVGTWPSATVASSCPSVRKEQLGFHGTDFQDIWYLNIRRKFVQNVQVSLKSEKNNRHFTWTPKYAHLWYFSQFFLEWEMFRAKFVERIKTHILCSVTFF